jgi:Histidine phosphatase superfamily (branch 1)
MKASIIFRALVALAFLALMPPVYAQQRSDSLAVVPPAPPRSAEPKEALSPAALIAELRKGGYVLYFRHAATDVRQNDSKSLGPTDCANQRNLTPKGREDARAIGRAFHNLGIPVGKVLASPTCRTVETANLIFGQSESSTAVRGNAEFPASDPRCFEQLRTLFVSPVRIGTNLGIASHGNPFHGVAGPPYLEEGELAVIRGTGSDFDVLARVRPGAWPSIVSAAQEK